MSDAFITSAFLALSGGLQDAYTYHVRNRVFANAQTGNLVLLAQKLMEREWSGALRYFFPVLAFCVGVFLTEQIQYRYHNASKLHWRQGVILLEIACLFIVGVIPDSKNIAASSLVSLSCAMQVQAFRKVRGYSYASTMCIGNLRSGTAALSSFCRDRNLQSGRQAMYYFGIIFCFTVGAGLGSVASKYWGISAIWCSCFFLLVSFLLMFCKKF